MNRFAALLCLSALVLAPRALLAQTLEDYDYENLEFRGLGFDLGSVAPRRAEPNLAGGIRADLGLLGPNLRIVPGISFWSSEMEAREVNRLGEQIFLICSRQTEAFCPSEFNLGDIRISDLALNANAQYEFITPYTLTPYLGAGVGVHLLNGSGELIDGTFVEDLLDAITPSLNALAGADLPLTDRFRVFAEGRAVLVSDATHLGLNVGGVWTFASPIPVMPAFR